MTNLAEFLSNS